MLIDYTYFSKGTRQIQNATLGDVPGADNIKVCRQIEAYIAEYQEEDLKGILGNEPGNKVNAYLVCLDDDSEQKRIESFDEVCERLKESFADYVFFHFLRDINEQVTKTGIVREKSVNTYVSPIRRQVNVWNSMVERHRAFVELSGSMNVKTEFLTKINQFNL